jgi:predicted DNA-binding antitoxin AbrB/MazE fold protein
MRTNTQTRTKRRRNAMAATIRARFSNGVLEPLEHLDVREGEVLTITIIRFPFKEGEVVLSAVPEGGEERSMPRSLSRIVMLTAPPLLAGPSRSRGPSADTIAMPNTPSQRRTRWSTNGLRLNSQRRCWPHSAGKTQRGLRNCERSW